MNRKKRKQGEGRGRGHTERRRRNMGKMEAARGGRKRRWETKEMKGERRRGKGKEEEVWWLIK